MSKTWEPWEIYKNEKIHTLPIEEPPCKNCLFWKPHVNFNNGFFEGVKCCVAENMYDDFSCYKEAMS
jgi:hypothetical protein